MDYKIHSFFPLNEQERKQLQDSAELVNVWESLPAAFAGLRAEFAELREAYDTLRAEHEELKQAVARQLHPAKSVPQPAQNAAAVGDIVPFGAYEWNIIRIQGNMLTLLCTQGVCTMPYQEALQWLNTDFYQSFSPAEKAQICEVFWPDFRMFVQLLKRKDAEALSPDILACGSWWWLLSEDDRWNRAAVVFSDGGIGITGAGQDYSSYGVRPVIMVKI